MKTIALVSGGKDSLLSVLMAKRYGHEPVVLANITPRPSEAEAGVTDQHEIDSYMYQTVGHEVVEAIAACMELPLRRTQVCRGLSKDQTLLYTVSPDAQDEVEELFRFLKAVKEEFPEVEAVTTGAILSNYQRNRVECVCYRLGLTSLAYLWQRGPAEILDMVEALRMEAILVKTASIGLDPRKHVGKTLTQMRPTLEKLESLYGSHMAGEGGEFETIVLNCPLFRTRRLVVRALELVVVDDNPYAPSGHGIMQVECCPKTDEERTEDTNILAALCRGDIHFPSDVMAALPRTPCRVDLCGLPFEALAGGDKIFHWAQHCSPDSGADVVVRTYTALLSDASGMTGSASATTLFGMLTADRTDNLTSHTVLRYCFLLPRRVSACEVKRTFATLVPNVAPAIVDAFSVVGLEEAHLVVTAAPDHTMSEADVLHAQSVSCWAAGKCGPFALARRFSASPGQRTVISAATAGLSPVDWCVVDASTMPQFFAESTTTHAFSECERTAVAQFAYAFANVMAYGQVLGCRLADARHVSVYTTCPDTVIPLLPRLWAWCAGDALKGVAVTYTVVAVTELGDGLSDSCLSLSVQWSTMCA